ncbi:MAG: MBL fold metallo-hydrolase [Rhizobiales bacterium]|nr:MBL fold metallo-hydrolase [Hyphomicrobiales bacterium]
MTHCDDDTLFGSPALDRRALVRLGAAATAAMALPWPATAQEIASARVGAASLKILTDGSITLPTAMLARGVAPAEVRAVLAQAGLAVDTTQNALNVPLLALGRDLLMFDCGAGRNFLPTTGRLPQSVETAGIDPAKVTQVLFTHAHPDHLWGALDEFDTPAYPNATYHMAEAEWAFWFAPDVFARLPEERHAFAAGAQRVLKALEPQLKRFRPGEDIVSGVTAFETGGHTPGHVSFEVRTGSDSLMILGDAFTHPVLSFGHPDWATAFDQEPERAAATRRRLLDRLASEKVLVATYHLPGGGLGRVERQGSAYRFVPAT